MYCWESDLGWLAGCENQISSIKDILTIVGILFAGYFGWMKFLHGRLYSEQLTPSVSLAVEEIEGCHWLVAKASIQNVGLRRVWMKNRTVHVDFAALAPDVDHQTLDNDEFIFKQLEPCLRTAKVFKDAIVIDPNETTTDSVAVFFTPLKVHGYSATLRISEEAGYEIDSSRSKECWTVRDYRFLPSHEIAQKEQ